MPTVEERRAYDRIRKQAAPAAERTRRNALQWLAKKRRQATESDDAKAARRASARERQARCRAAKRATQATAFRASEPDAPVRRVTRSSAAERAADPDTGAGPAQGDGVAEVVVPVPQHDIRRASFRTHRGVRVKKEWVIAARQAFELTKRHAQAEDAVENPRGRYGVAIEGGRWNTVLASRRYPRSLMASLEEMVWAITSLARKRGFRKNVRVRGRRTLPHSLFIRPYSADGARDELPNAHHDTLDPGDGSQDKTPVVSAILVLEGGRSESGVDVEAFVRAPGQQRPFELHLDTGVLGILGNEVKHQVRFVGEGMVPPQGGWSSRLTVVAFYKRGDK